MQLRRADITAAMTRVFASNASTAGADNVAAELVDILLDHVRGILGDTPLGVSETSRRHRKLGVASEHYSLFGDMLAPIMKDLMGAQATSAVLSAWGDAYWAGVRSVTDPDRLLAA
jgi:hypothetical protein